MVKEILIKKLIEEGLKLAVKTLGNKKELDFTKEDITDSLNSHLNYVKTWSQNILFRDMTKAKSTEKLYIDLNIRLTPKSLWPEDEENIEVFNLMELFEENHHLVILGDPGAGKTTTVKYLCRKLLFDEVDQLYQFNFPILIQIRTLNTEESIYNRLEKILGFRFKETLEDYLKEKIINKYLDELCPLLLIDGLDEAAPSKYFTIIKELNKLFLNLSTSKVVLSCRSGAYDANIDNTIVYELCPLDKNQILQFVNNWFLNKNITNNFLIQLEKSPYYDTAIRPITLAHLCALFEKYQRIPDKPKSVYQKIINLLLEEWDTQRGIVRESKYSDFESDRKREFLAYFAYQLTFLFEHKSYNHRQLKEAYTFICETFELPQKDVGKVISEIESHNGLIVKSSYNTFDFSHKSLQEFLSAEYIVKMPEIPDFIPFERFKDEFSIAVCLSSNPTEYLANLVFSKLEKYKPKEGDIIEFLNRLYLEKPTFVKSPVLPLSLFFIYDRFFSKNEINELFYKIIMDFYKLKIFGDSLIELEKYGNYENSIFYKDAWFDSTIYDRIPNMIAIPNEFYLANKRK